MHEQTSPDCAPQSDLPPAPARTRFRLRDVGAAVSADVYHRSERRLTVRRELPFLRVGADVVDEDGREAKVSSVRVYVENDVPTLILDLRYSGEASPSSLAPPRRLARGGHAREEETVVFGTADDGHPRIVSHSPSFFDGLVSNLRRLVGLMIRVARATRQALASHAQAPAALPRPH